MAKGKEGRAGSDIGIKCSSAYLRPESITQPPSTRRELGSTILTQIQKTGKRERLENRFDNSHGAAMARTECLLRGAPSSKEVRKY